MKSRWYTAVLCGCLGAALAAVQFPSSAGAGERSQTVDVGRQLPALIEADWIERDRWFAPEKAKAEQPAATKAPGVTTVEDAEGGCDGIKNGRWGFHTASGETDPWWQVDLGQ